MGNIIRNIEKEKFALERTKTLSTTSGHDCNWTENVYWKMFDWSGIVRDGKQAERYSRGLLSVGIIMGIQCVRHKGKERERVREQK